MKKFPLLSSLIIKLITLSILLSLSGCTKSSYKLSIKNIPIDVEIADTPRKMELGLMYRNSLKEGSGMLFIYTDPKLLSFWMKNTLIPLSIAFIDEYNRIISIQNMEPQISPPYKQHISPKPAKFALEVPQGWFERNKISEGDVVEFPKSLEKAIKKSR